METEQVSFLGAVVHSSSSGTPSALCDVLMWNADNKNHKTTAPLQLLQMQSFQ